MRKNILVVVESLLVEESSGAKANLALIRNLRKAGFNLRVFHYSKKKVLIDGIQSIMIDESRTSLLFFLSRFERYLRKTFNFKLNKLIDQVFGFSFTLFNDRNSIVKSLNRIEDFNPDLVLTLSQGASFRPHHALLRIPKWHHKWVAYIHDPYPMHSYPRPYDWVEPGHQKKRKFFLRVTEKAEFAAFPSKLLEEWMAGYYPSLKGKSVVIPHQINEFSELLEKEIPKWFNPDKFNLLHAGTLLGARNPTILIEAFEDFIKEEETAGEESTLIFLGPKSEYNKRLEVKQKLLKSQLFYSEDSVHSRVVFQMMKKVSVNLILESKGPISPFLPGKFPVCIQAGKPILLLGPVVSESRRLLGKDYSWWSEIDDRERIKKIISQLYLNWKNGKDQYFSRPDLIEYLGENRLKISLNELLEN